MKVKVFQSNFDAVEKVWSGPENEAFVHDRENTGAFLLDKLNEDSHLVTQVNGDTGESLTKVEIRIRTIRCAQNLTKLGCTQNDIIGVVARNHHNLTPLLYGALCNGTPFSPFDVVLVQDGLSHILERVRPTFIFCDADVLEPVKNIVSDMGFSSKFFTVNGSIDGYDSIDSLMNETGEEDSFVCAKLKDSFSHAAVISCSSGSTGLPKSICLSHALFNYILKTQDLGTGLRTMNFSSMYWLTAILSTMSASSNVTRIFTAKPFTTDLFFDLVEKYKVQLFSGLPSQMQVILRSKRCETADLSSLVVWFLLGSVVPPVLVQSMKKALPKCFVMSAYGMTEVCGGVSCTVPTELEEYPKASGRLMTGVKVKIINQNTEEKCGVGEEGEIYVKVPIAPMGYYKAEAVTQSSYDSEGYFITGDLGYFDEAGRLYINGGKKEVFKSRSRFSIWPGELENIILKHPDVQVVSVVSVHDDETISNLPAAVIVKKESCSITVDEVYKMIADELASYKRLDGGIYFVNELPMTPSGKIVRAKVGEIAQNFYQKRKICHEL